MDTTQIENQLNKIITLLKGLQPKPKKLRQSKIVDDRKLAYQIAPFVGSYPPSMINDFLLYWEEGERWRKEKVFDIPKRLERWKRQQDKWDWERSQKQALKKVVELPQREERERVDTGFTKLFE